jgi:threonine dehydrogenase-like Zn-dependent dehydrogenase
VSFEQASYACLGATALQAVRRTIPQLGEFGLVAGLGIVGNLSAQLSSLCGTRVLCWETLDFRVKTAKKCGLKNFANPKEDSCADKTKLFAEPYGYDFGIIAFGGNGTTAFKSMQKQLKVSADGHEMGRIILVGGCEVTLTGGAALGNVDVRAASRTGPGYHDAAWELGADYPKAFVQFTTRRNLIEIITLIDEKRLIVEPMTTHRIKLEDIGKASDALINTPDKALGVSVQMSH